MTAQPNAADLKAGTDKIEKDAKSILAAVRTLAPAIAARSAEIEQLRRLPDDLVVQLREAGAFRMAMPRSRGGPQMTIVEQILVLEELSRADASVGWCAKIGADSGYFAGVLPEDVADELMPELDTVAAGFAPPGPGRLERVEGGYRLSGRFPFGSGSTHADLFFATGIVFENDKPAAGGAAGLPAMRIAFVPASAVTVEDTWFSTGLSGTGSNHWLAENVFIPERHTLDVFTELRRPSEANYAHPLNFTATMSAVPLGIMRRGLDEAREHLLRKQVLLPSPPRPMSEVGYARGIFAEAEASYGSARAYVLHGADALTRALAVDGQAAPEVRAAVALSMVNACRAACDVTRRLFDLAGTAAIHQSSTLGRLLRDAMTANQHVTVGQGSVEVLGGVLLGADNPSPFF